jgi:hypothetical protein
MTTLREDIPDAIDVVVRRALEPDREKRWPDLDSFLKALEEAYTTGKIPAGLVPAEELPVPTGPGAIDQETQFSDANRPTVTATQPPPQRRRGRAWVIAGMLAGILAAGGGYGGYELVMNRPVTVEQNNLSVQVPREWDEKAASSDPDALLVSTSTTQWPTSPTEAGVFVGVVNATKLPSSATPPTGCQTAAPNTDPVGEQQAATFRYRCGTNPPVVERYLKISETQLLRIQVRSPDQEQLEDVLNSAQSK